MTPSNLFWIDILAHLSTIVVATAILLVVMGSGTRRPVNRSLALYLGSILLWASCSLVLRGSLWFESGTPLRWLELTVIGLAFTGPTLFLFLARYVESEQNWHPLAAIGGMLIILALSPLVFSHQVVNQVWLGENHLLHWKMTPVGYVTAALPFAFEALALMVLWQYRRVSEPLLVFSAVLMLLGGVLGAVVRLPIPTISLTMSVSVAAIGYAVMRRQFFNPLRTLTQELEFQVEERTRELQQARNRLQRLNEQQRIAAQVSREASRADSPQEILERLVNLIHNRLGYHHVYAYQVTEPSDKTALVHQLRLEAAAGTTARTLMETGHSLPMGPNTLVGRAASERRAHIVHDWDAMPTPPGNTALPGVRAEVAVPMITGNQLLGVLSVQSIYADAFSEDDLSILTILADQTAAILDNARLLQRTQEALAEMERVQQQYMGQAWQSLRADARAAQAFVYTHEGGVTTNTVDAIWSPEIGEAVKKNRPLIVSEAQADPSDSAQTLALPIRLRGQIIGALKLRRKQDQTWQPEEIDTLSDLADRLGLTLETVRLSEEAQRRANRERFIREITDQIQKATDLESLMWITTEELRRELGAQRAFVHLGMRAEPDRHSQPNTVSDGADLSHHVTEKDTDNANA